jgi:hypothetical protein
MAHERLLNVLHKEDDVSLTYGSCLCGSIKYTLSGAPSTTVLCHCISCKKSSGSAFKANGFYQASVIIPLPAQFHINNLIIPLATQYHVLS